MNLTPRDKKLLVILGVFILSVVYLKFLLLPKINDINVLKSDIASLKDTYAVNMAFKTKTESIDSDIKILSRKLEDLRTIYPPSINSDELIILLTKLFKESDLKVTSLQFEQARPLNIQSGDKPADGDGQQKENANQPDEQQQENQEQQEGKKPEKAAVDQTASNGDMSKILNYFYLWGLKSQQDANSSDAIVIPDGKGYCVSVKLEAAGTNAQVKSFLDKLGKLDNRAYCKTSSIVQIAEAQDGRDLKFTAEIDFLGIMDKGAGEYYLLPDGKWIPMTAADKDNIFQPYSGYEFLFSGKTETLSGVSNAGSDDSSREQELEDYDFSAVAAAFGGGFAPSVSVECRNPLLKNMYSNPVVYGDNKGIENAEIFIEEKSGKYYCKFKTDHETYPDKEYSQTFEFVPVGKALKLAIISSERTGEDDKAGLNLSIINNTKKNLIYRVKYEDKEAPRVKIGKTVGSINHE